MSHRFAPRRAASRTERRCLARAIGALATVTTMLALGACSSDGGSSASPTTVAKPTAATVPIEHATGPSKGCEATTPARPGTTDDTIESGGDQRHYQLIVPESYDGTHPIPVVFALHSLTIDYHVVPASSGLTNMAKTSDFITVAPSGLLGEGNKPYWNAVPVTDNGDVVFLGALLDHLEATLCVDTAKVVSIGMSNGAQMSSLLACRMRGRITGIGPIAGVEYDPPCASPPTPVIAFHGAKDPIVPFAGGGLNSVRIADQNLYKGKIPAGTRTPGGVEASMARWARHNGCDPEPKITRVATDVVERVWQHCAAPTVLYVVEDGGHAWPGMCFPGMEATLGHCTEAIDATQLMFRALLGEPK